MTTPEVKQRAQDYCDRRGYSIDSRLGVGTQGSVYVVNIPYLDRPPDYSAEVSPLSKLSESTSQT